MSDPKPDWVRNMEAALEVYYKEPVRPVSEYCNALRLWRETIRAQKLDGGYPLQGETIRADDWTPIVAALDRIEIPIVKSNLLARLIYGGEKLRTKRCPVHKGIWSGCQFEPCPLCHDGLNVTGWVREDMNTLLKEDNGVRTQD